MKTIETKATVLFQSQNKNRYFFDRKQKKNILCHPVLYYLLELREKGVDPGEWFNHLQEDPVPIPGSAAYPKTEVAYYYRKYLMFKDNGYFDTICQEKYLCARMSEEAVKNALANTNQVTLEITDQCNLDCTYCGYGHFYCDYDKREKKNMDPAASRQMIDFLVEYWNSPRNISHGKSIYISFYGGEPLLNFSFIKETVAYVKQIKAQHNRFFFSMTTNALLLEKYMDYLVEHDFNILVSLDGNEQNNSYRLTKNGEPSYPIIMANLITLKKKFPAYFAEKVNFNAVIHNKNSVSEVFHYFKKNFNKHPRISALNTSGINEEQKETFWNTYANPRESLFNSEDYSFIEKEMFIKLPNIQDFSLFLHRNNDFCFDGYCNLLNASGRAERYPSGTCVPFSKKIFVTVNGKILACEHISHEFGLGSVDSRGVKIDFAAIARQYNSWFDQIRKQCHACYNEDECVQCIYQLDLKKKNNKCNGFMNANEYPGVVAAYMDFLENKPQLYTKILKDIVVN